MRYNEKAVVLNATRHAEKKFVVRLLTPGHGLVTAIAFAGHSKTSRVRTSHLLPLTLLEVNLSIRQNKEIAQLNEASCYFVSRGFAGDAPRLAIAQLITETLSKCLKEHAPSGELFRFIEHCVQFLNEADQHYQNLHLYFLRELSGLLGFEPQNNFSPGEPYFDCREGRFSALGLSYPLGLNQEESLQFSRFLSANVLLVPLSRAQKQGLLHSLSAYYLMHVPGFDELNSIKVLQEVLS